MEGYGGYAKIYVNNALSKEIPGAEPDNRPDIMAVRWDGKIDQFEVKSITDNKVELDKRMEGNQKMMGTRAGKIKTLFIPEEKGWHLNGK